MPFSFEKTNLEGVILVKSNVYKDCRGFFLEGYKKSDFIKNEIDCEFVQDNISVSSARVLRGLHFQSGEFAQAKLVRCLCGKIYDVAVDLRKDSSTFKKYLRVELSAENGYSLFIPRGFAHGFVVLSESATLHYKVDNEYNSSAEGGILWNDSDINIDWGIEFEPILSEKDMLLPTFKEICL